MEEEIDITTSRSALAYLPDKLLPPPTVRGMVARPRLLARLDRMARDHALTMVTGTAGAGKTTLLAGWAAGRPTCWVTLDLSDDHPDRFWPLLLDAVGAGPSPLCDGDPVCDLAVHALDAHQPVVLVLDGFEHVSHPEILAGLERLLHRPPPDLHVVVATRRAIGGLHVSRLMLEGRAGTIDADALRFTPEETAEVLAGGDVLLEPADLDELWRRTQGWPAAVRLAGFALADAASPHRVIEHLTGDEPALADYQTEELLDDVDEPTRRFLLRTSVADELSGDLADALTDTHGGGGVLSALRRWGLPVSPLDEGNETYRYHPLFAGMLRARLVREEPVLAVDLHRRAAGWHREHGAPGQAVSHALRAGDDELVAAILRAHLVPSVADGELPALVAALADRPEHERTRTAECAVAFAISSFVTGDADAGRALLRRAAASTPHPALADALAVAMLLRRMADGEDPAAPLPEVAPLTRGVMQAVTGASRLWGGDAAGAERDLAGAATHSEGHDRLSGATAALLAVCRLERGATADAQRLARAAIAVCERVDRRGSPDAALALSVLGTTALETDPALARAAFTEVAAILDAGTMRYPGEREYVVAAHARWLEATGVPVRAAAMEDADDEPLDDPLSAGELAILRYLPSRLTNQEIAGERCLSVNTVKTHLKHIYRKLDACDRDGAVRRARTLGLLRAGA